MTSPNLSDEQPTGDRLDRAKALLRDAMDLDDVKASEWVREQAGDDESLCGYVLKLLSSARSKDSSFRAVRETATDYVASLRPETIGRYRILDTLGQGGMGTVYLAEQTEPVKRQVALKLVKLGMDSEAVVARFEQERQSLAVMEHDGIAKVHDCGTSERGQPYFVMELVRGARISDYCDDRQLSVQARIALLQQICDAVQHAHQKGVVHRDLKPSNVLVVESDGRIQVKVIDFGLAKAMTSDTTETPELTEDGQVVGTLEYMAPEQADPNTADVDTRADVYSLGVMLYELLVGSLPFADTELRGVGVWELQRIMRDVEPPRPSRRLSAMSEGDQQQVAGRRRSLASTLQGALRRDLDWVVLRAMAKDRAQRYESASALAADLQRYLDHEPLLAGPPSASYRFRKFVRRYRSQVIAASAVLLTALLGAAVAVWFAFEAYDLADQKGQLAVAEAAASAKATRNAGLFEDKVREFDLLSGVVLHERCVERVSTLQPPWPVRLPAMRQWLDEEVQALMVMRPEIEVTLKRLRSLSAPRSEEQMEESRRAHARYQDLVRLRGWVDAGNRAAAVRAGGPLKIPEVPVELASKSAEELFRLSAVRVVPVFDQRTTFFELELGLALAKLAAERAKGTTAWGNANDLLAWAWLANGDDEQALATADQSVVAAADDMREASEARRRSLDSGIENAALEHAERVASLELLLAEIDAQQPREFALKSYRFLYVTLSSLLTDLDDLRDNEMGFIQTRSKWAQQVGDASRAHPTATVTWAEARAAIAAADDVVASRGYAGQTLTLAEEHVVGLVPIGMNPVTLLWEFYHLASAWDGECEAKDITIPKHNADGSIDVTAATGMVFVLVPGGEFVMGAQGEGPNDPNFDAEALWYMGPPHRVTLDAFLLARHEITQAQWARMWQGDEGLRWPSKYRPGVKMKTLDEIPTILQPVDQVSWVRGREVLHQYGLRLPTEAQWEYACRAGTSTPFFCDKKDVKHYANLADAKARRMNAEWAAFEDWDDGYVLTSPVGSLRANPWGFFDIIGNVVEWCEDGLGSYKWPVLPGDGLRPELAKVDPVVRGGSNIHRATFCRSSMRTPSARTSAQSHVGLRAARSLQPLSPRR